MAFNGLCFDILRSCLLEFVKASSPGLLCVTSSLHVLHFACFVCAWRPKVTITCSAICSPGLGSSDLWISPVNRVSLVGAKHRDHKAHETFVESGWGGGLELLWGATSEMELGCLSLTVGINVGRLFWTSTILLKWYRTVHFPDALKWAGGVLTRF